MFSASQSELISYFANAVLSDALRQCYIINSEAGLGKSFAAEMIKQHIVCDTNSACGECNACLSLSKGANPDCYTVTNGDKKIIELAKIRAMIKEVYIKPISGRYKLFIIDNAHLMEAPAQNALLKVVEEPPSYAVFILITDNIGTFLPTILSRSMVLELKRWSIDELKKLCPLEKKDEYLYDYSLGNPGVLNAVIADEGFKALRETAISGFINMLLGDETLVYDAVDFWLANKDSKEKLIDVLTMFIRDIVLYKSACIENITNKDKIKEIQTVSEKLSLKKSFKMLETIGDAPRMLGRYGNFAMLVQNMMIQLREETHD